MACTRRASRARRRRRNSGARFSAAPLRELVDESQRETGSRAPLALERISSHHHRGERRRQVSYPRGEVAFAGEATKPSEREAHVWNLLFEDRLLELGPAFVADRSEAACEAQRVVEVASLETDAHRGD